MTRAWAIYTLADPQTGDVRYVGMTFRYRKRFIEHLSRARRGARTYRDCWIRSLLNRGIMPAIEFVEYGQGDGWQDAERRWIAYHGASGRLVNLTSGGEGVPGYIPTPELRALWSRQRRGVKYALGRIGAMTGRTHTAEARAKISLASTGRRHTDGSRAKLSIARKGKPLTAEHRKKLSEAKMGRLLTEEHKQKIASSAVGRKAVLCVNTGQIFASITEASRVLGVSEASVNQAIRKPCRCRGNHLRFA